MASRFSTLSETMSRIVLVASNAARKAGLDLLSPELLLRALLAEEDNGAAESAMRAGLRLSAFQSKFPLFSGPSERIEPTNAPVKDIEGVKDESPLPFDRLANDCLHDAREIGVLLTGDRTVTSEAVLLAILRLQPSLREQMTDLGLDCARLEEDLRAREILQSAEVPLVTDDLDLDRRDLTQQLDTLRVLDAGGNRAREALRVLEDYCRFALGDALLTEELKKFRHDLTSALDQLGLEERLQARDTLGDVGTTLSTTEEYERTNLRTVVAANFGRLQESLRSLEEFGKVRSPRLGALLETLRYRVYTLERALILRGLSQSPGSLRQQLHQACLYVLLSGQSCLASLDWTIAEAAAGGAEIVQLREKTLTDRELLQRARDVRRWTSAAGVLFILNDRPDLARLVEADGVHLGQDDLPIHEARRLLGPGPLIGMSTHSPEQARQAILEGADYIGVGPTFASTTKTFDHLPGPSLLRAVIPQTTLPAFAIGGINHDTAEQAVAAGARRIAVGAAVAEAPSPRQAAQALREVLQGTHKKG